MVKNRKNKASSLPKISDALKNKKPKKPKGQFDPNQVDPSQFDQGQLQQMGEMMKRMPKGQVQRIQSMMQRAMQGKDVSAEAAQLEKTLPPEFHEMVKGMAMPGMEGMMGGEAPDAEAIEDAQVEEAAANMSEDDAKKVVEQALADGTITEEQAKQMLAGEEVEGMGEKKKKGLFGGLFGGK